MINSRRSTIPFVKPFESYFTEEAIIRQLCKERAKKAKKRSDATLCFFIELQKISGTEEYSRIQSILMKKSTYYSLLENFGIRFVQRFVKA